jgi:hypothetical protein
MNGYLYPVAKDRREARRALALKWWEMRKVLRYSQQQGLYSAASLFRYYLGEIKRCWKALRE